MTLRTKLVMDIYRPSSTISLHVTVHKEGSWRVARLNAVHSRILPSFSQ